jgi:hypothetical protein
VTSNDGVNWTEQIIEIGNSTTFNDIIYANDLFVVIGKPNVLMTSNDGINWTVSTIAAAESSANFKSIVYGNGLFAIVSLSNNILTSTDCVNWTAPEQSNVILKFNDIIYANGLFVAVDNNGNIRTSTDCINWTIRFTYKYYFTTLAYGNGLFVACGGTYSQIATSTDGINWENTEHVFSGSKVSYCKDKFIYGGSYNAIIKMCSNKPKALLNTCFYSEYQLDIIKYGQCGKFAIDLENKTFRVPLIKDGAVIQQALTNNELGKAYNAGIPDIYATAFSGSGSASLLTGAIQYTKGVTGEKGGSGGDDIGWDFKASRCSSVYNNSDTVQMNAVAMRYFVVVANGQTNQSMMDWSAWASSLQGKANADLSNCSKPYILETYENGKSGYNVYSNGYCEQWGYSSIKTATSVVTLLKPYRDLDFNINLVWQYTTNIGTYAPISNVTSVDSFTVYRSGEGAQKCSQYWETKGYIR